MKTRDKKTTAPRLRLRFFGTFSKGIDNSLALNFGVSGGANCSRVCPHHPDSSAAKPTGACYAEKISARPDRQPLLAKLERHQEMPPALLLGAVIEEYRALVAKGVFIPWVRFSAFGSVPQPKRASKLFKSQLRAFIKLALAHGSKIHLPTEGSAKARWYRELVGDLICVRESVVSHRRFLAADGAVSAVAGELGTKLDERVTAARELARKRREKTGRKCIVCPAVANTFAAKRNRALKNENAKCGCCVACSQPHIDIVYPIH